MSRGDRSDQGEEEFPAGTIVRRRMLGTDATYRVVGAGSRGIEVEVVDVPGLRAGSRFTFLPEVLRGMDSVAEPARPPAPQRAIRGNAAHRTA